MAFNKTMAAAFRPAHENGLTATERHVLLEVCNGANKTARLFPSHQTIATRCGYSRATVIRAMNTLEALGWISRERRRRKDGTRTTDLLTVQAPTTVATPDRLLPLMTVVSSTPVTSKVAPCNSDKVAPCDLTPGYQSRTVQQQNPISKNLTLEAGGDRSRLKSVDHDPAVADGLTALLGEMKAKASAAEPKRARRTLERRAG